MAIVGTDLVMVERAGVKHKTTADEVAGLRGPKTTVSTAAPADPAVGDLWVDTN